MKNKILYAGALAFTLCGVQSAHAGKDVTSPYVTQGEWEVESKTQYAIDSDNDVDGTFEQTFATGYGVTDFLQVEAGIEFEDEPNEDIKTKALEFEAKFQLAEEGEYFVDPGVKFEYIYNLTGGADKVEGLLLLGKKHGQFEHLANLILEHEIGEDSEDRLEYAAEWKTAYEFSHHFAAGIEYYGEFGDMTDDYDDQEHLLGPVAYGHYENGIGYDAGVLAGISNGAPDATLKLNLHYEF